MADLAELVKGLPPTIPTYWRDSYKTMGESQVLRVALDEKKHYYIILDETLFHPKGGGQPSDKGAMAGSGFKLQIKKVMHSGPVVVHWGKLLEGTLEKGAGSKVKSAIDWDWRFLMMKRHSTAHLLDYCLAKTMGRDVDASDSWLGDQPYVAYHGRPPSREELDQAEELENRMISEGRMISIEQVSMEEARKRFRNEPGILTGLRLFESVRLVTVEGCRPIACGGTHLANIHEAKGVRMDRVEAQEDGFRVFFDLL